MSGQPPVHNLLGVQVGEGEGRLGQDGHLASHCSDETYDAMLGHLGAGAGSGAVAESRGQGWCLAV